MFGSQQGLPCGSMCMVTTGQKPVNDGLPVSPHSIPIPHLHRQSPSTSAANAVGSSSSTKKGIDEVGASKEASVNLPNTKVTMAACLWKYQIHTTSNNTLPHALEGKCT